MMRGYASVLLLLLCTASANATLKLPCGKEHTPCCLFGKCGAGLVCKARMCVTPPPSPSPSPSPSPAPKPCGKAGEQCCKNGAACHGSDLTCQNDKCMELPQSPKPSPVPSSPKPSPSPAPKPCGKAGEQCCDKGAKCRGSDLTCQNNQCVELPKSPKPSPVPISSPKPFPSPAPKPCGKAGEQCCKNGAACHGSDLTCQNDKCVELPKSPKPSPVLSSPKPSPSPAPKPCGKAGEQCCDQGAKCHGSDLTCQNDKCVEVPKSPKPSPIPSPPKCGGKFQPCCSSHPACQGSLKCKYVHGYKGPVCASK